MKKVVILATGGTIASMTETLMGDQYQHVNVPIDQLIIQNPAIMQLADLACEQLAQIDSSEMTQALWLNIAKKTQAAVDQPDVAGVVITHGTDTIEETAYFLNLVVKTHKPVILTGAMRPSAALSSDGLRNLYNAVVLARDPVSCGKGVLLTFNDVITTARDVTKTNVSSTDSFRAPELGLLGYIQGTTPYFYKQPTYRHTANSEFDATALTALPRIEIIYGYADASSHLVDALIDAKIDGIISAGLGKGLQSPAVQEALLRARQAGIFVVRSSRVMNGVITYDPRLDGECGFIAANTLIPQKARILLALALTRTRDVPEIQRMFNTY